MSTVGIVPADPRSAAARRALTAYALEVREAARLDALDVEAALDDVDGFVDDRGFFLLASRDEAEIKRMWVSPELRGSGLAVQLLKQTEHRARALGYRRLLLDTNGALTSALRFYPQHGYQSVERYNDNPDATHFFAKDLTPGPVSR